MKKRNSQIGLMLIFLSPLLLYYIFIVKVRNLISSSLLNATVTTEAFNRISFYFESSINYMLFILYCFILALYIMMRKRNVDKT